MLFASGPRPRYHSAPRPRPSPSGGAAHAPPVHLVPFTVPVCAPPPQRRCAPPQPLRLFARARPLHVDTTGAAATA